MSNQKVLLVKQNFDAFSKEESLKIEEEVEYKIERNIKTKNIVI